MKYLLPAALALTLAALSPAAAEIQNFGKGTQFGRVSGLPDLPPKLRAQYRKFQREALYFGAMAVNFDTGDAFYLMNFHDAGRARAAALEGCRVISAAPGCTIYAVAMPKGLPIGQSSAQGLSDWAYADFTTRYREHRKPGTYAAFAISGASHHGYGNAYETEADARDTAISYCQIGVAKDMAELGPDARKFARARGWQNCRVVDVAYTPAEQ